MPETSSVSFLMIDIQDSTRQSKSLGGEVWLDLLGGDFDRTVKRKFKERNGGEFQRQAERGDDCVKMTFDSPRDAVACAVDIQNQVKQYGLKYSVNGEEHPITLHAAIHTFGRLANGGPDIAQIPDVARILKESQGGQILLSQGCYAAYCDERNGLPFPVQLSGEYELTGIAEPQRFYTVLYGVDGFGAPGTNMIGFANIVASDSYIVRRETERIIRESFGEPVGRAGKTRFVTVHGEGGMGKTRLGVTCALQLLTHFPGGIVFVPFARLSGADRGNPETFRGDVANTIHGALRQSAPTAPTTIEDALLLHLAGRPPTLLLLDNTETVATEQTARVFLQKLLDTTGNQRHCFLATSRQRVGLTGEKEVGVNEGLTVAEAFDLFAERAKASFALPALTGVEQDEIAKRITAPRYELPEPSVFVSPARTAADVARLMDGARLLRLFYLANFNTLSIEVIASWTATFTTPHKLMTDYEASAFGHLAKHRRIPFGGDEARERHSTVEASYQWSWKNLGAAQGGADAQILLLAASLFVEPFTQEAVATVTAWNDVERVAEALAAVDDAALIRPVTVNNETRYRMHWQLQAYGRDGVYAGDDPANPLPDRAELRQRFIAYYRDNTRDTKHGFGQVTKNSESRGWIEAEWRNVAVSAEYADTARDWQAAVWLRLSLASYLEIIADWRTREQLGLKARDAALQTTTNGNRSNEGAALTNLGNVYQSQGKWQEAETAFNEAIAIYREFKDRYGEGKAWHGLGNVYQSQGKWQEAETAYDAAIAIYREFKDIHGKGMVLGNLAMLYGAQKRMPEAVEYARLAVAAFEQTQDAAMLQKHRDLLARYERLP